MRRRAEPEALARHEELDALARYYHHLHNELERTKPEGGLRRQLQDRVLEVRERFDRLLDEWVPDAELRDAWREYLHNRRPEPEGPPTIRPLVFQGVSDAGSVVEIRGRGDELEVRVDGALVERIAGEKDFSPTRPVVSFRLNGTEFHETFGASPEALAALADYRDAGGSPPWEHASELLADGLVDVHFALTPRGRRALERAGREQ